MDFNKYTIRAQESIRKALELTKSNGQQTISSSHLIKAILMTDEHIIPHILKKSNISVNNLNVEADKVISTIPKVSGGQAYFSEKLNNAFTNAEAYTREFEDDYTSLEHLLLGILKSGCEMAAFMKSSGLTEKRLKQSITELRKGSHADSPTAEDRYNALNRFARNLNQLAREGKLDPVIGRDEEIRRVLQILSRRTKNNPVLIGEPGVGKTAIAEGIAHRIIDSDVPENLLSKEIFSLDLGALVAGAKYKGEFEDRLKSVIKEVVSSNGEVILFIDEIHTLVGAGGGEGAMDAANILKPALARGELRAVGATTLKEYQKYFEADKALERRFQVVMVDEPDIADAVSILRGLKERYENHHKVRIMDEAIISAVELSHRYISDRFLPDKAIDLIDEAAARLRLEINSVPEELDEIERKIRQLEIEREAIKREDDKTKLQKLNEELANHYDKRNALKAKWQEEKSVVEGIQNCKKQIESYKLEASRAEREGDYGKVAELRYGKIKETEKELESYRAKHEEMQKNSALIDEDVDKEDIAEIVSRWTGIPVGKMMQSEKAKLLDLEKELHKRVVGQEEAIIAVSDAIRRSRAGLKDPKRPIGSFIFLGTTGVGKTELARALAQFLFDDERAMVRIDMSEYQERHAVSRLIGAPPGYVGYDEGGQLTEAVRRKPYSVVLLDEIEKAHPDVFNILLQVLDDGRLTDNKGRIADFKNTIIIMTSNSGSDIINQRLSNLNDSNRTELLESTQNEVFRLLRSTLRPEFLNRIDEVIMFSPLVQDEISQIVKMQIDQLNKMLEEQNIEITVTDAALEKIADLGYDPQFGARPVKRVVQREILNELSKMIIEGKIIKDEKILLDFADGGFVFGNIR